MRRYISYLACAFMLAMTVGCVKTDDISAEQAGVMTLQLRNNELVATRATTPGVVNLNENLISTVQCFFSTDGATVLYATDVIEVNDTDGDVENLQLTIPADKMGTLFPNGAIKCNIYVVANAPEKITATAIATIKDTAITLAADGNNAQPTFVMDGSAEVTKANDNSISGTVNLTRAAAKILVTANINKQIVFTSGEGTSDKTETWEPDMASIRMTYHNSATKSKLSAEAEDASEYKNYAQPKTKEDGTLDGAVFTYTVGADKYVATQEIPFYSYPRAWDDNATNKPYIELVIPWKRTNETQYSTYTYQIPLDIDAKTLERNYLYKLTVNVGILGSLTGDVTLSPSYVVIDWGTGTINAELSRPKYLVVDQNFVEMHNVTSLGVPYQSSDAVTARIISVTKPNYSSTTAATYTYTPGADNTIVTPTANSSGKGNTNSFEIEVVDGTIKLSHTLVNDNKSNAFDYVPYTITVEVTNEVGFTEQIIYKQYPAIYVENKVNSSQTTVDKWSNGGTGTNGAGYGYVMVNSLYSNRTNAGDRDSNTWYTVESFDSSSNNPNMYVITTTSLDASLAGKYILGDSREETTYTAQQVGFTAVEDVNGKKLNKYRPTKTDREDYLSPKFRISSAYGQLGYQALPANYAKYRCAAYQEDGYPAGRWRLATTAELEYIAMLCAKGALPISLFGGGVYWSATNSYNVSTGLGSITVNGADDAFLRCVYDDWYWGSEQLTDRTKYMWGDESTTAELNAKIQ